jgi:hypothetical protein
MEGSRSSLESSFFLAQNGSENAEAEFLATQEFLKTPEGKCKYPARAIYFGIAPEGKGELCDRWKKWKEAISAEGIELVFAAAYMNSPSSMYGHTLLKFPRSGKSQELLDYTFNYGANTGDAGGFSYIWKGLTGGFSGFFSTAPFYLKVKEYNHVENRDFWIYPILLSKKELELLVAHAWELREVASPYYFLRKNCSYYLLQFLEVAKPGAELTKSFPFWAVPMDTIRRLKEKGLLGEGRIRPARQKQLEQRRDLLSSTNQKNVLRLLENVQMELPHEEAPFLLDTAYELWRFRGDSNADWEKQFFERRKSFAASEDLAIPKESAPETGHDTDRLYFAGGKNASHTLWEIGYRGALHDLLSNPLGYEPSSELSMGDLRFRLEKKKFFLERADLLRLRTVAPWERWFPRISWSFRLGYERAKEFSCEAWKCGVGILSSGIGWGAKFGPMQFFLLGEIDFEAGSVLDRNYRIAAGPVGGLFFPLWSGARFRAESEFRARLLGEKRQKQPIRLGFSQALGKNFELRLEAFKNRNTKEGWLQTHFYF